MNNMTLVKQFVDTHGDEIAALIADLGLQDVTICYDGRPPEGLDQDPFLTWEWWEIEHDDMQKSTVVISMCWDNIISHEDELRYGVIVLAQCLQSIVQERTAIAGSQASEFQCDKCRISSYEKACQDATDYAYEA